MERRSISEEVYSKLPAELQELTKYFGGREKDIVLLSSLTVLSNCFPNVYGVYDGNNVYPHLYLVIIAPAASGKGVMNKSRILIEKIHDKVFKDTLQKFKEYENRKKVAKEKVSEEYPVVIVKILPANISTSEMYSFLDCSNHGLIIIESEADTISIMLKNDWSNYSDVLRKAFHHEPISISRKIDKLFKYIKEPKLAVLISGTPDQLQPLIKSKENGLYSRFMVYNFDEISPFFKDVFSQETTEVQLAFENMGMRIFDLYYKLIRLQKPIEFLFTENQKKMFKEKMDIIRNDVIVNHSPGFVSIVHRHGLMLYRLAMILTVLRGTEDIHEKEKVFCDDIDFAVAFELMEIVLGHSQYTYNTIETCGLSSQDEEILDQLKDTFTRKEAVEVGEKMGILQRTIDDKLVQFRNKRFIKKIKRGEFKKL
ncbi:hypothetical protein FEDK69T_11970 [Flavobacterium enshiense DK69]|uniref:DUF3987 domain-containing protein n=1 Tax=Flavobacterium enshiense DK69 TaxID=1107311 RepID=V6SAU9_9FLAO|nr:DUF3987 domain-containing protein [Flavobacterium enshiense]ESU23788.1 hypothetical protein FEDK69T_11970 [Flavobacterium enshiense DK69]KGO96083.1 hypothetical protein Q767_07420 [Flavobacterium enshiense DK69]